MGRANFSMIIPSLAPQADDLALDRLMSPARHFNHPDEVLHDPFLDTDEKRAILASSASDACAVDSIPALRRPPGAGEAIPFDVIMDALQRLDKASSRTGERGFTSVPERERLDA